MGEMERIKKTAAAFSQVTEWDYWREKFAGQLVRAVFPYDHRPGERGGDVQAFETITVPPEVSARLTDLSNRSDYRLYLVFTALLNLLLYKYTGQEDVVIGTPIFKQETEGDFINTVLPLRNRITGSMTFKQLLLEGRETVREATEHQNYPVDVLAYKLGLDTPEAGFALFDTALVLETIQELSCLDPVAVNVVFVFSLDNGELRGRIRYNSQLYESATIRRLGCHFVNLAASACFAIDRPLAEAAMLDSEERREMLHSLNRTAADCPTGMPLTALFEAQVEKTPDKQALVDSLRNSPVSYREVNRRANRLAHFLMARGIGTGQVVAVLMTRSVEWVVTLLGILKTGATYLPLDAGYPRKRVLAVLKDAAPTLVLTSDEVARQFSFVGLKNLVFSSLEALPVVTPPRGQITDFEALPAPDRTLVDYGKYHNYIGIAMAKHTVAMQTSRGCPFNCAYCHKIWPKRHVVRGAENTFREMRQCYDAGVRRFVFIDDIFNLEQRNSKMLLRSIIDVGMDLQLFFPNGLRGDILTRELIDLMVEAGTVNIDLALETASPRLQKLVRKDLNLEKFEKNVRYITENYPHVLLEMELMTGFPSETEEEAEMTLAFLERQHWLHFPNLNILKIFPNTDMHRLALENGVPAKAIEMSTDLAYHQLPETLPFSKDFARQYQARFMNDYFFSKERLLKVLPYQAAILSEDELVQKYDSYLPTETKTFDDVLDAVGISKEELGDIGLTAEERCAAPDFNRLIGDIYAEQDVSSAPEALRVLFLDLSLLFSDDSHSMLYDTIEAPLGLMYLATYLDETYPGKVECLVLKSRIDFDSYEELKRRIETFEPHLIGIRTLSVFRDFFHRALSLIKTWTPHIPVIAGGPYATSDYRIILQDPLVDLVVLGEGEHTMGELAEKMMDNGNRLPDEEELEKIHGIAFYDRERRSALRREKQEVLLLDLLAEHIERFEDINPPSAGTPDNVLYMISTSGSTGVPKSVMVEDRNLANLLHFQSSDTNIDFNFNVLQFASAGFDVSLQEIFSTLLAGGTLCVADDGKKQDLDELFQFIRRWDIRVLFVPPALLKLVFNQPDLAPKFPTCVRHIIAAGEQLIVPEPFKRYLWENDVVLHNHYGPTETHVVTTLSLGLDKDEPVPTRPSIGTPIGNNRMYIMHKDGQLLPRGIPGELVIAGANVGRGYCNNPDLTAERFGPDPFFSGERIYKTGDLARYLPDGAIEFIGRMDHQVKIRGFRVELGEVETRLLAIDGIEAAAVLDRRDGSGDTYLCAYVSGTSIVDQHKLRDIIREELPDYMVPAYFLVMPALPLTASGKIDRKALPEPEEVKREISYVAPRNQAEQKLTAIWSDILEVEADRIGVNDNFFALGGHSLKATIMLSRVNHEFSQKISLAQIFKTPTVAGLAAYIAGAGEVEEYAILPAEKRDYYPLSSAQRRLYVLRQMEEDNISYNLPMVMVLEGVLDLQRFKGAMSRLIQRHESLRTYFQMKDGRPVQRVADRVDWQLEYTDSPDETVASPEHHRIVNAFVRPFDLTEPPLLRVGIVRVSDQRYIFMVDMHHIITDGTSMGVIVKEFMELYDGEELPTVSTHYRDFAVWQTLRIERGDFKSQEDFWLDQFSGELPVLDLPLDFPRSGGVTFEGEAVTFQLPSPLAEDLGELAGNRDVTLFMVLKTLLHLLLAKLSGQRDIIIGTAHAGRGRRELQHVTGMLVNTLAIRSFPSPDKSFEDFMNEIKDKTLQAFDNQDFQFEDLVARLGLERDAGQNPLFSVMFVMQNMHIPEMEIPGLKLKPFDMEIVTSMFDLSVIVMEDGSDVSLTFIYRTNLFREESVRRMFSFYKIIARQALECPAIGIEDIDLLADEDKTTILDFCNGERVARPTEIPIHLLFTEQAATIPGQTAVIYHDRHITYRELGNRSDKLAGVLVRRGVAPGVIVGLLSDYCLEVPIVLLGILKAGGAYFPLDSNSPAQRSASLLKDCCAPLVLNGDDTRIPGPHETLLIEDCLFGESENGGPPLDIARNLVGGSDVAYVMFTSGSTGTPKGVMVEHRNVVHLVTDTNLFHLERGRRLLQTCALSFDPSTMELWGTLLNGLTLCAVDKTDFLDPYILSAMIHKLDIGIIFTTTAVFHRMVDADEKIYSRLSDLLFGGEVVSPAHAEWMMRHCPGVKVTNCYGPTEGTTISTAFPMTIPLDDRVPIGRPIPNSTVYIVDPKDRLLPAGVPGELLVGGDGVARGYMNRPELTMEKFQFDPFAELGDRRVMYRTGDRARWLDNGTIEFLGRLDQQVKIRGFRVELGEIEARLAALPFIREAVVRVIKEGTDQTLCGHVTTCEGYDGQKARQQLLEVLPEYMVPDSVLELEAIPLTPNGKVDVKRLPDPLSGKGDKYRAPANPMEETLANLWGQVLNKAPETISATADFFETGGHSLQATTLAARLREEFSVTVPLVQVFEHSTIERMAAFIAAARQRVERSAKQDDPVMLREGQVKEGALLLFHDGTGRTEAYVELCHQLRLPYSCWAVHAPTCREIGPRELSMTGAVAGYVEKIVELHVDAPLYLAGWSLGGMVAFEAALQLEQRGYEVAAVVMIDSAGPTVDGSPDVEAFNPSAEMDFVNQYISACTEGDEELREPGSCEEVWESVVRCLERQGVTASSLRTMLVGEGGEAFGHLDGLDIRKLVSCFNTIRSWDQARSHYVPSGTLKAPVHFVKAGPTPQNFSLQWQPFCNDIIKLSIVQTDHYLMLHNPGVSQVAMVLDDVAGSGSQ
jgi:amino acid adenylation domain-containing protein